MITAEEKPFLSLFENFSQVGEVMWIGLRPASRKPIIEITEVNVTETGLEGDRATKNSPTNKRQVTLIQYEHLAAAASFLGKENIDPNLTRRNIVVKGMNLNALKGRKFSVGTAILEMTGFCYPCSRMEENLGLGGFNAMRGHGGITCRVIETGKIKIGDNIKVLENEA
ncbi:MOSC domain-containing protein [Lacihabitans sp. CCS-44]|uniref:MOSC domain-containing protein n=1 Tax=Lacihabitans sp. CCS-44 TaxID=2487331 RepID=UPI0020CC43C5|nr:MOSC domain-containing protein [Lacihabitans sp. CCS-44]MCP9754546.1 MOSC domain-containing protein [Lacihabitans sp. CCS-44]